MTDREWITLINAIAAAIFIPLLLIGTGATIARALRMTAAHRPLPLVLRRDLVSRSGLTIPIAAIVLFRAAGITGLSDNLAWIVTTDALFIISVGTYAYFELFIIEKPRYYEREHSLVAQMDRIEVGLTENTRVSQEASDHADAAYHEANSVNEKIAAQGVAIQRQQDRSDARDRASDKLQGVADATAAEVHDLHDGSAPEGR